MLANYGFQATVVPIVFGVAGTVYHATLSTLHDTLGLSKQQSRDACSLVHSHAVRSLASIFATKRFLEHQHASAAADVA